MSNPGKYCDGKSLLIKTCLLALLSVYSTLCYSAYVIKIESHLNVFEPKIMKSAKGIYCRCDGNIILLVDSSGDVSYFGSYLNLYQKHMPMINKDRYRKKLYDRSYAVLIDEILHVPGVKRVDDGKALAVPDELRSVYNYWVVMLAKYKRSAERSMCSDKAVAVVLSDSDAVLSRFVKSYNDAFQSDGEISRECKRPEETGWTQSDEAKQYAMCIEATSQGRRHKDKLLISYRALFNYYKDIFDKNGLTHQILDDKRRH